MMQETTFTVKYTNALQEYRETGNPDAYLKIVEYPLDVNQIAAYSIFQKQITGQIPDDTVYELQIKPFPRNGTGFVSKLDIFAELEGNENRVQIPLEQISILNHRSYFDNNIHFHGCNLDRKMIHDFRLLHLGQAETCSTESTDDLFISQPAPLKTFTFCEQPHPQVSDFICWNGGVRSQALIPIYIARSVLETFIKNVSGVHPQEIGAQLGGNLLRDKAFKYMCIDDIELVGAPGTETSLNIPATEFMRSAGVIEKRNPGNRVVGWLHNHGFAKQALFYSDIDLRNHYYKYSMPFGVMLIADSGQLTGASSPAGCADCPAFNSCNPTKKIQDMHVPGWTLYAWNQFGACIPVSAFVFDK